MSQNNESGNHPSAATNHQANAQGQQSHNSSQPAAPDSQAAWKEGSGAQGASGSNNRNGPNLPQGNTHNTIGHYVMGKALGEGTFGKVKLGTHILTGEKVAVKVLEKSRIKDKKDVERISREIKILKQLHHPNVVQIYEIIETEKDLYLVMEFVQGGELFDLIVQNQRLKEKAACKYFQELISGINYIHQLGICHRDLKPENLLIDYDLSLKIVDFGLSNLYEQGSTLKTACGSPCYAAPEMIAGQRYNGLMSDLWSCGVVLYAMLCGYLPYEDQKTSDLYKKILNADYNLPDFLSDEARDMIAQIFITDPSKRINIDQIRKHPWYQLNKPETNSFMVCPPQIQAQRSDTIVKNNKQYQIIQRPNLLNQEIISKLENQHNFNRESLLKSIKNNKHNHLTATYYLLLKKHMIRHFKPYCDAFMELKLKPANTEVQSRQAQLTSGEGSESMKQQQPQIFLQSKQVQEALKSKKDEKTDKSDAYSSNQPANSITVAGIGSNHCSQQQPQKPFQSIEHNQIIGENIIKQNFDGNNVKRQNYLPNSNYNTQKADLKDQREVQASRQSNNNSRFSQKRSSIENGPGSGQEKQFEDNQFSKQTQQSFAKPDQQKGSNAFHQRRDHRREQSANPYIGGGTGSDNQQKYLVKNQNIEQYQNQVDQISKKRGGNHGVKMADQIHSGNTEQTRNSRWKQNQIQDTQQTNSIEMHRSYNLNTQKSYLQKSQISQDSFKNVLSEENHPSANAHHGGGIGGTLINPYQVKKRSESYNNKRTTDKESSLEQLNQLDINIEGGENPNGRRRDDEQIEYEYIQSKNIKQTQKGQLREIRAPSSGSSGSQPRVVAVNNCNGSSGGQLSVNSSGVQRRYDSIEHQRQSQIDKFLKSPQEQIASMMNQKGNKQQSDKYSKKMMTAQTDDNHRKAKIDELATQNSSKINNTSKNKNGFSMFSGQKTDGDHPSGHQGEHHQNYHISHHHQQHDNINLTNVLKNSADRQQPQSSSHGGQKKNRNSSSSKNNGQSISIKHEGQEGNQQYYRQLQQQLVMYNNRRGQQSNNGALPSQSSKGGKTHNASGKVSGSNGMGGNNYQNLSKKQDNMTKGAGQGNENDSQQNQKLKQQQHRKAKSMLNENGQGQSASENTSSQVKVQQIKLSDENIRQILQQIQSQNSGGQASSGGVQNIHKLNINNYHHQPSVDGSNGHYQKHQQHHHQGSATHHGGSHHGSGQNQQQIAPTMPQAPKSGNVLKLKPQVVRHKSSNNSRGNSQTLQNNRQQSQLYTPHQQQFMLQQQLQIQNTKKQQILHTTKNTTGQANKKFDMTEAVGQVQDSQQTSIEQNTAAYSRKSHQPLVATSQGTAKSGKNIILSTHGNSLSISQNSQTEGYLQNLIREYEKTQKGTSSNPQSKNHISNNSIPSQQQVVSQAPISQNGLNQSDSTSGCIPSNSGQNVGSGGHGGNKRSTLKVQKIQKLQKAQNIKAQHIENIQKHISQNQKAMKNMTQNLLIKNNAGGAMSQKNYEDYENINESLRGSSRGQYGQKMSGSQIQMEYGGSNQNLQSSCQIQRPQKYCQQQNSSHQLNTNGNRQPYYKNNTSAPQNNQPNTISGSSNVVQTRQGGSIIKNHYQTQDDRKISVQKGVDNCKNQDDSSNNLTLSINQQSSHPNNPNSAKYQTEYLQSMAANSAMSAINAMGGMEGVLEQIQAQMGLVGAAGQGKQGQGSGQAQQFPGGGSSGKQHSRVPGTKNKASSNQRCQSSQPTSHKNRRDKSMPDMGTDGHRGDARPAEGHKENVRGHSTGVSTTIGLDHGNGQEREHLDREYGSNGHGIGSKQKQNYSTQVTQMSIMSKYNQQQYQIQMSNKSRDQRNVVKTHTLNTGSGVIGGGMGGHSGGHPGQPRHYSAPREGTYGGIDEDEMKRQHLLNQSVDMSQINNLQAQINNMGAISNLKKFEDLQQFNLSHLGQSLGGNNIGAAVQSTQNQRGGMGSFGSMANVKKAGKNQNNHAAYQDSKSNYDSIGKMRGSQQYQFQEFAQTPSHNNAGNQRYSTKQMMSGQGGFREFKDYQGDQSTNKHHHKQYNSNSQVGNLYNMDYQNQVSKKSGGLGSNDQSSRTNDGERKAKNSQKGGSRDVRDDQRRSQHNQFYQQQQNAGSQQHTGQPMLNMQNSSPIRQTSSNNKGQNQNYNNIAQVKIQKTRQSSHNSNDGGAPGGGRGKFRETSDSQGNAVSNSTQFDYHGYHNQQRQGGVQQQNLDYASSQGQMISASNQANQRGADRSRMVINTRHQGNGGHSRGHNGASGTRHQNLHPNGHPVSHETNTGSNTRQPQNNKYSEEDLTKSNNLSPSQQPYPQNRPHPQIRPCPENSRKVIMGNFNLTVQMNNNLYMK